MAQSNKTEYIKLLKKAITDQGKQAIEHASRVKIYSKIITDKIIELNLMPQLDLTKEQLQMVPDASYYHDIGKVKLQEEYRILSDIRNESGKQIYMTHVDEGFALYDSIVNLESLNSKSVDFFGIILSCILEHHERFDGRGFPNSLRGEEISIAGRITAVADQLDNYLTTTRDKEKVTLDLAIDKLQTHKGTRFDPKVVDALVFSKPELEEQYFLIENGTFKTETIIKEKNKPMELYFRPIFDTLTRQINSYEAVLRLYDEIYGPMFPKVYMVIAERNNYISELTEWTIKEVASSYKSLIKKGTIFEKLYIQVSAKYLARKYSADNILKILKDQEVNPTKVCIELSESLIADLKIQVIDSIKSLRRQGISVALYNFGSDYSSLSKIDDIDPSAIIISSEFASSIVDSNKTREVVKSIVQLSKNLKIDVLADGIETKSEEQIMKELGIKNMMGSFYGEFKKERYLRGDEFQQSRVIGKEGE